MAGIKALFFVLRLGAKTFIPIMCDLRGRPAPEWFQSLQRVPVVARCGGDGIGKIVVWTAVYE